MNHPILTLSIASDDDIVRARQTTRDIAALLGFEAQDQTRIAACVSEIARNASRHAGSGIAEFGVREGKPQAFAIHIRDKGPGIRNLEEILSPNLLRDETHGMGLRSAGRLADHFQIKEAPEGGTLVELEKIFTPKMNVLTAQDVASITQKIKKSSKSRQSNQVNELERVNTELLAALCEMQRRQEELEQLNKELDDTNRGVLALYAELDERADVLRRVSDLKSHFLSNMSHEFRTPLNSILSLSRILLDRMDGDLTQEQEKQVTFIRRSAQVLLELVNDLLDIAKAEAGKLIVRPSHFEVAELFSALRGMLRPLQINPSVELLFEEPAEPILLQTDEAKVSQILRNLISNALKYTERGEVKVSVEQDSQNVIFRVTDTGIGISQPDQLAIFEEFVQVENPLQKKTKGTGLGLPLSLKLAQLMGGDVWVESAIGSGSSFYASIPMIYKAASAEGESKAPEIDPMRRPVLVVEDNPETQLVYEKFLENTPFQFVPASTAKQAQAFLEQFTPFAIVLDIILHGEQTWGFLSELRRHSSMRNVPIYVVTILEDRERALTLGANDYCQKPPEREWLIARLEEHLERQEEMKILLIDDDETARYVAHNHLRHLGPCLILEASGGEEGIAMARREKPKLIFLDLMMEGMDGFATLERLKEDAETKEIPVIIYTSKTILPEDRKRLAPAIEILAKGSHARDHLLEAAKRAIQTKKKQS